MSKNHHHFEGKSSSIEHVDYHDDKDTLEIKFTSGATYHYPGCPKEHYHQIKAARSAGQYFIQNIKQLRCERQ